MKAIHKRLAELERRRQLAHPSNYDPRKVLMRELDNIAERMRGSPNWPPDPLPTVEEVQQRINQILASREARLRSALRP